MLSGAEAAEPLEGVLKGEFGAGGGERWFSFDVGPGSAYRFDAESEDRMSAWLVLEDESGQMRRRQLFELWDERCWYEEDCHLQKSKTWLSGKNSGRAYVVLEGSQYQDYRLEMAELEDDHANWMAEAEPFERDLGVSGKIEFDKDEDWFWLEVEAGKVYVLEVTQAWPYDVHVRSSVIGRDGSAIEDEWGWGQLRFEALETGRVHVVAEGKGGIEYQIQVIEVLEDDLADERSGAKEIALDEIVVGVNEVSQDQDWFVVELEAGRTYMLDGLGEERWLSINGFREGSDEPIAGAHRDSGWWEAEGGRFYFQVTGNGELPYRFSIRGFDEEPDDVERAWPLERRVVANSEFYNDKDVYWFDVEAGEAYRIAARGLGETYPVIDMEVLDADGNRLGAPEHSGRTERTATENGRWYVSVSDHRGPYVLGVERLDVIETGSTADAKNVTGQNVINGSIETEGGSSWLKFNALKGEGYSFEAKGHNNLELVFSILGEDGQIQDASYPYPWWVAPAEGTYFIRLETFVPTEKGEFELLINRAPDDHAGDAQRATRIGLAERRRGQYQFARDIDWFEFEAKARRNYRVLIDRIDNHFVGGGMIYTTLRTSPHLSELFGEIYSEDGTKLAEESSMVNRDTELLWAAPEDGVYRVAVSSYSCFIEYDMIVEEVIPGMEKPPAAEEPEPPEGDGSSEGETDEWLWPDDGWDEYEWEDEDDVWELDDSNWWGGDDEVWDDEEEGEELDEDEWWKVEADEAWEWEAAME